jgi:predicted dehydrogenase
MTEGRLRIALVGVGKIARDQHVPAIRANPAYDLVATASPHGTVEGVASYPDLDSLLGAGLALDAVSLCTPPGVRAGLAEQALAAGLHVMLEKPPAATLSQVEVLRRAAAEAGRSIMATWHSRETSAVDAAAAWLADRPVREVRMTWREDVRVWHPGQDWLLDAGGFGVFDPAINGLSILTRILPGAIALDSAELGVPANRQAAMTARLTLRHGASPVLCDLSILHPGHQQWDIVVEAEGGTLSLSGGGHVLAIAGEQRCAEPEREYPRLYDRFTALVAAGASELDAAPLMLVADATMAGRVTRLEPFEF